MLELRSDRRCQPVSGASTAVEGRYPASDNIHNFRETIFYIYNLTVMTLQMLDGISGRKSSPWLLDAIITRSSLDGQALQYHYLYKNSTTDGLQTTTIKYKYLINGQ